MRQILLSTLVLALFVTSLAVAQRTAFPLKVSTNGRYFVDKAGKPFLYHADTGWQIFARLTLAEAREYLTLRQKQGFNTIQVMVSVNPDSANRTGQKPLHNYDFSRPNEAYFAHVEKVVAVADSLGLLFNMVPFWISCCRDGYGVGGKNEVYARNGVTKTNRMGKWLGKRFGKYANLVWTIGGDNDPLTIRQELVALAEGIRSAAPHQLISFHARPPHSSTDLFQYAPWLGFSMIYTYWREKPNNYVNSEQMPHVYEAAQREYLKSDRTPFILGESQYEGSGNLFPNDLGLPQHVRRQAWWTILSGGTGHAYGQDAWSFPAQWRDIMHYPGTQHMRHVITFFESMPWWQLVPDLHHQVVIHGYGEYTKANYATAAVTEDKAILVAYLPEPGPLTIDLSKLKGPHLTARWYNPRSGEFTEAGNFPNQGVQKFYSPLQEDWVLVIRSEP